MRVVMVGGVAGGMSAATRLRRLLPEAQIVVFERDQYVSYANCGLPYHVGGVIADRDDLLLQTPDRCGHGSAWTYGCVTRSPVSTWRPDRHGAGPGNGEVETVGYDRLVLSPGAGPIVPPLPGIERALTLRTSVTPMRSTRRSPQRRLGRRWWSAVGSSGSRPLRTCATVASTSPSSSWRRRSSPRWTSRWSGRAREAALQRREPGARYRPREDPSRRGRGRRRPGHSRRPGRPRDRGTPETTLAKAAGLTIGPRGGIAVDETMRTSDPFVYAVGDAVEKPDHLGSTSPIPLANTANRQGRLVADAIAGRQVRLGARLGTAIVRVFDLTVGVVGANERRLRAAGRPFAAIHTHPANHAGYYPGAQSMSLKVLYDPADGTILGAQGVGGDGVDKRIDVIATAMRGGLRVEDLADLELAYAPPYGSAKDPVNMVGYIADNRRLNSVAAVAVERVGRAAGRRATLVDVRTAGEYAAGHVPGAINVPLDGLRERLADLPGGDLIGYCQVGQRAHTAAMLLASTGRTVANLDGGYTTWLAGQG